MSNYSNIIVFFLSFLVLGCQSSPECDCSSTEVCDEGKCVPVDQNDMSTNNGTTIISNNGTSAVCQSAADCPTNELCSDGTCVCDTGTHRCGDTCVSDNADDSCGELCEACPTPKNATASCEQAVCKTTCNEGFRICDTAAGCPFVDGSCISCEDNSECTDPKNPTCSEGSCVACTSDLDCTIDKPVCSEGACEVCSATNENACGGKTCNPATSECTDVGFREKGECEPCVSDSQCQENLYCVPTSFKDNPIPDGFCLRRSDLDGCPSPFATVLADRVSLSGREADRYCGPDESLTTCKAVLDYNDDCGDDDDCGLENVDDAVCAPVEFEFARCSFHCSESRQCPSDFSGCWRDLDKDWWCGGF